MKDGLISDWEIVFLLVFALMVFVIPSLVAWFSYSERFRKFDLRSLWEHNGRIDKLAVILMGTWWLHSSSMVLWTLMRSVTTADWVTYQLWAIPILAKILNDAWAPKNGPKDESLLK